MCVSSIIVIFLLLSCLFRFEGKLVIHDGFEEVLIGDVLFFNFEEVGD